ncbi:MAG: lipocalin family protein [Vampirovibrionales bacterium]|nr:lipocalin family protein [Vampirovibrionales bacterium]
MKRLYGYGVMALFVALTAGLIWGVSASEKSPKLAKPATVEKVDLARYMGKWYEIASMPMYFQRRCVGNTTATYSLKPNGRVSVLNACDTREGRIDARAEARVMDPETGAKLKVSFLKLLTWQYWLGGDYWILALEPTAYRYAIVGHPHRRYGWVLSRTPQLSDEDARAILTKLETLGYDPSRFISTPQTGGWSVKRSLPEAISASTP